MIESSWENAYQKKQYQLKKEPLEKKGILKVDDYNNSEETFNDTLKSVKKVSLDYPTATKKREEFFPKTPETVTGYNLNGKNIGDSGVGLFTQKYEQTSSKKQDSALFLAKNNIGETGIKSLSAFLKKNTSVKHLILSHNKITDFAVAALADLLKVNHHIGWLVLNGNAVGNFGIKSLSDSLSVNKGVKHLILSDNKIGDEGVIFLCNKLKNNQTIKSIFLQGNPIGSDGINSIHTLLEQSSSINVIDIRDIGEVNNDILDKLKNLSIKKNITLYCN